MSDHAETRWPPNTEALPNCGHHCTVSPGGIASKEPIQANAHLHCPCRFCHHAFHHCRDGKTYVWFGGRWAEVLTAQVIS